MFVPMGDGDMCGGYIRFLLQPYKYCYMEGGLTQHESSSPYLCR